QGIAEFERALALDRNLARAHAFLGHAKYFLVTLRKLSLTSRRRSASVLAIRRPMRGWRWRRTPSSLSAATRRRWRYIVHRDQPKPSVGALPDGRRSRASRSTK